MSTYTMVYYPKGYSPGLMLDEVDWLNTSEWIERKISFWHPSIWIFPLLCIRVYLSPQYNCYSRLVFSKS